MVGSFKKDNVPAKNKQDIESGRKIYIYRTICVYQFCIADEFLGLVNEAKAKVKDEKYQEGLLLYQKAMEVHHSKKLEKRIEKLKVCIKSCYFVYDPLLVT